MFGGARHTDEAGPLFKDALYEWLADYDLEPTEPIGNLECSALRTDAATSEENCRSDFFTCNPIVITAVRKALAHFYRNAAEYLEQIVCNSQELIPITIDDHNASQATLPLSHIHLAYRVIHFLARRWQDQESYAGYKSNNPKLHVEQSPQQTATALRKRADSLDPTTPHFDAMLSETWLAPVIDLQVIMFMTDYQNVLTQEVTNDTHPVTPTVILWCIEGDDLRLVPSDFHLRIGQMTSSQFKNNKRGALESINPCNLLSPWQPSQENSGVNPNFAVLEAVWMRLSALLYDPRLHIIQRLNGNHFRGITAPGSVD